MRYVSLASTVSLTARSERTLWRWIADGTLTRSGDNAKYGKAMVQLESIIPYVCIQINTKDHDLIVNADNGDAEAQNDLALLFMSYAKPESAIYWLKLAADQNYADAMHWLGRCYIDGNGVARDENLGIMWLSKAAAHSHSISQVQMQSMRDSFTAQKLVCPRNST
ncbi:MAG: Sel1-like [Burkholderia sp.]|nr:Sel1-like [Burkholderia sp.]